MNVLAMCISLVKLWCLLGFIYTRHEKDTLDVRACVCGLFVVDSLDGPSVEQVSKDRARWQADV